MQHSLATPAKSTTNHSVLLISVLLLVDSLHFVFARLLLPHISPNISAMYVQGIGALLIAGYALATGQLDWQVLRRHVWFFLAIGVLIAVSTNLGYIAVQYVDAGTASMLGKISTLFGIGFGLLWLGERLTNLQWIGAVIAIVGSFTIAFQPGDYLQLGSFMILAATLLYALHTAIVKRYGGGIDFINFFFFRLFCTTVLLLLWGVVADALIWPAVNVWLLLLLVAVVDVIISRVLYYVALRRLHMSIHSLILTLSPAMTILWSYQLFGQWPTTQQLIGGAAVSVGVMIVLYQKR